MNFFNTLFTRPAIKVPQKIGHFLVPDKDEELERLVKDNANLATYNVMSQDYSSRMVLTSLRDVPSMLQDAVIGAALACLMNTAFQTKNENQVFEVQSATKSIEDELKAFHEDIDAQNLILMIGYNLAIWGQLPFKHCFNKSGVLERVIPIPDFTKVTPIIISGKTVGFMADEKFHPSYEYTYAQVKYYKNLGGNQLGNYLTMTANEGMGDIEEFKNEFTYADSYLGIAAKPWRNIQIIEDALLLSRMDQSNYYRIISVNVGGSVYSKSAIQVLNYYRNLFKKVRRVSYDASGMASKGSGQDFEVIIPQTQNQGIDVKTVGGELDIRALKDLDTQYNRLFSSLQIQPSMIGFSQDMPSSLGESTATLWDKRFAKVCKVYNYSSFEALRNIDYLHLRSKGYDVNKNDWTYSTVSSTMQDDKDKGDVLATAIENYDKLVESFQKSNLEYNSSYLVKTLLGGALSNLGVDPEKLLNKENDLAVDTALTSSYRTKIIEEDAHIMSLCGVFDEKVSKQIVSALTEEKQLAIEEKPSPITLKELCSSVAVHRNSQIKLDGFVVQLDCYDSDIESKFTGRHIKYEKMCASDFVWPVYTSKAVIITASDLEKSSMGAISKLYIDEDGKRYILNKRDLLTYIHNYINESLDIYCETIVRKEK